MLAISIASNAESADKPNVPNIVFILADDMGFSDLGCYGGDVETPNIDRLAAGGLRYTQFYNTARCWPTRSSLMSGYYPQQVRMDPPKGRLPAWAKLAPHYLKPLGYRSYHSGKWHISGAPKVVADGGFDHSYKIDDHDRNFNPKWHTEDDMRLPPVPPGTDFYLTTHMADVAIKHLKQHAAEHADKPFFEYLAFTSPHFPLHALQEDIARYKQRYLVGWDAIRQQRLARMKQLGIVDCELSTREVDIFPKWNLSADKLAKQLGPGEVSRAVPWSELNAEQKTFQATKMAIHAAMIDRMDRNIGRVLDQIKAMGAWDNTIVFFASDNGASAELMVRGDGHDPKLPPGSAGTFLCLGPGWSMAANTPLRLHKSYTHEGGISTPLVVHWPAGIKARGELRHAPGHVIDFLPTILELNGVNPAKAAGENAPPLPGRSLVSTFAADRPIERDYLFFSHDKHRGLRVGDWKAVELLPDSPWALFNLKTDRAENRDLAAEQPEKVKQMAAKWQELDAQFAQQAGPADAASLRFSFYAMDTVSNRGAEPLAEKIEDVRQLGYDGISWTGTNVEQIRRVVNECEAHGVKLYALYVRLDLAKDKLVVPENIDAVFEALKKHNTLVWLNIKSKDFGVSDEKGDDLAAPGLQELADRAAKQNVRLAIYPHITDWTEKFGDALRVAEKVDRANFGVTFNLCHALKTGDEANIDKLLRRAKPRLLSVTINGADANVADSPGWTRLILPLGQGSYDVGSLLKKLTAIGYSEPVGFQGYGIAGDRKEIMKQSIDAWKKLTAGPDRK